MSEKKHTPSHTPGKLTVEHPYGENGVYNDIYLLSEDTVLVAKIYSYEGPGPQEANAARLAQCWNSHDEMLEVLTNAASLWAFRCKDDTECTWLDEARAAIAKARGES